MAGHVYPVAPPVLQEPVISLLRSAQDPLRNGDETNGRWVGGISYQPYDNVAPVLIDPCDEATVDSPPAPPAVVNWVPYVVKVFDQCSAIGFGAHNFKERLDTAMRVGRHKAIEKEFWGGALTTATGTGNAFLTESPGVTDLSPTTAPSIKRAMQILEQGLADCGLGGRGMIHMRPDALPPDTQARREGNLLLTQRDTILVVGNGYPNTGPGGSAAAAGTTWLFATGMVDVRVDTANINYYTQDPAGRASRTTDFTPEEIIGNMNRDLNLITTRAEMFALASWDEQCWLACKANLDT